MESGNGNADEAAMAAAGLEQEEWQPKLSVLEQEYMVKARERQKAGITKPQVVAGREFKGVSFISKPEIIEFKDFTVGMAHTQTILMTNVSFSFNSFKLVPLEDKIKDFFHIQYTPSGRMSAGLSTTITITFTPQLNEDIDSYFPILSEQGLIKIPLKCTCKKALVSVDDSLIDFGNVIFGEQNTQYMKLENKGALATKVYIKTPHGKPVPFVTPEDLPKGEVEPSAQLTFDQFLATVSFKRTTEIDGYSSTKIQFTFIPLKLGDIYQKFTLFLENQDYTKPIPIEIKGNCVDVPIYVDQEEYNLQVLVYEQLYREKIILHNRGQNAMKIQLIYPRDFKPYLDFNPTLGFIQGNSSFEIWAKLKPDRSILQTCARFLVKQDDETPPKDEYEEFTMRIPIKVTGANQVLPVRFSLLAVFTVNAVTFTPPVVDFGSVFNQSASRVSVCLENHSLLPQQFSFVRLPKEISVVTDKGTGTILPGEKYTLKIEYRPSTDAIIDENQLIVRFITGELCVRELKLPYACSVVKCPIKTDKCKIEFPCLPEQETSEVVVQMQNESKERTYLLETVPPNMQLSGIVVNPLVTSLAPGRSTLVSIKFNSKFRDINYETMDQLFKPKELEPEHVPGLAVRNKKLEEKIKKQREDAAANAAPVDPKAKGGKAPPPKAAPAKAEPAGKAVKKTPQQEEEERLEAERVQREAEEAEAARIKALEDAFDKNAALKTMGGRVFDFDKEDQYSRTQHYEWLLPVYFKCTDDDAPAKERKVRTVYLESRTTTVPKSLESDVQVLDFGEVPVALRVTKEILVKNVGNREEKMKLQSLSPFGGFSVLNAMRTIKPGETRAIVVQFEPLAQQIYEERIVLFSDFTTVSINMKGIGVRPEVNLDPEEGLISFGNVLVGETLEKTFKIENISSFPVKFELKSEAAGVGNKKKTVPYMLIPSTATIQAKETYTVKILFQPDHASANFFDVLLIDIPNQIKPKRVYLRGQAWDRQLSVRVHQPFDWRPLEEIKGQFEKPLDLVSAAAVGGRQKILLEFTRDEEAIKEEYQFRAEMNRVRSLSLGSARLLDIKMEKNGTFELNAKSQDPYFECDMPKGNLNGGQDQVVKFTFKPPQVDTLLKDIDALTGIGQWVESVWECKLQGGFVEPGNPDPLVVDIVLRAYVQQI